VLDHVDIEIEPGEVVARRRSGSSYRWADRDRRERGSRDRPALCGRLPGTSAVAVAISGGQRRVRVAPRHRAIERCCRSSALARCLGLGEFGDHYPRQVSGGMAQRAGLARALARRPSVLLLDEPLAALDALTRLRMQDLLDTVQQEAGTITLLVTHDVDEALILADRVLVLRADAAGGARIAATFEVTIPKPRDRGDSRITVLREQLLDELGVPRRTSLGSAHEEEANTCYVDT